MTAPRCRHARTTVVGALVVCLGCDLTRRPPGRWCIPARADRERADAARVAVATAPGPGRLPADEARTHTVEVRVSAIELAQLDAYARSLGCGRSEAVRRAVAAARGGA